LNPLEKYACSRAYLGFFSSSNLNIGMSDLFSKAFFKVLNEQDELPTPAPEPVDAEAMSDADAMASTLDQGTEPTDFDIHAGSREASVAAAKSHAKMIEVLGQWITKVKEFSEFLKDYALEWSQRNNIELNIEMNGVEEISLQAKEILFRIVQEALANIASSLSPETNLPFSSTAIMRSASSNLKAMGFSTTAGLKP
jgi:hypothetical protein